MCRAFSARQRPLRGVGTQQILTEGEKGLRKHSLSECGESRSPALCPRSHSERGISVVRIGQYGVRYGWGSSEPGTCRFESECSEEPQRSFKHQRGRINIPLPSWAAELGGVAMYRYVGCSLHKEG